MTPKLVYLSLQKKTDDLLDRKDGSVGKSIRYASMNYNIPSTT